MSAGHAAYFLMDRLILNCDLGEDEPIERTDELLSLVDAANINCGYHAGNFEKTATALKLAQKYGVKIGAHPGIPIDGGRGSGDIDPTEFRNLLDMQLGTFQETARYDSVMPMFLRYYKIRGAYLATSSHIIQRLQEFLNHGHDAWERKVFCGDCCKIEWLQAKM
jgi:lactam utilization protein B